MEPKTISKPLESAQTIISRLSKLSGGKVLDIATGDGVNIRFLMKALKDYESFVGIDISSKMLTKAKKTFSKKDAVFYEMSAESLTFPNNSFDTVCIRHSLHHLPNPQKTVAEMKRVLKPNGLFLVEELYSDKDQTTAQINELLVHELSAEIDTLVGEFHRVPYTRSEITQFITNEKLTSIEIFNSTQYPRCFFCDYLDACSDPMRKSAINQGLREIRNILKKIKDRPEYSELYMNYKLKMKPLRKQIREYGYGISSILFLIAKK